MSETPETEEHFRPIVDEGRIAEGRTPDFCRHLESDRNRWRSVAEQLEKFARFQKENGAVGPVGERLMNEGLAAFDSLRKEGL